MMNSVGILEVPGDSVQVLELGDGEVQIIELGESDVQLLELGVEGPQGPPGQSGAAAAAYVHNQIAPSTLWTVTHGLGFKPGGVMSYDSVGRLILGNVEVLDDDTLTISFTAAIGGLAYIS